MPNPRPAAREPPAARRVVARNFAGEDVRDGLIGAVAIKLQDPVFESQTKNKLGSTEVRTWMVPLVKDQVLRALHQNETLAKTLIDKVKQNEKLRKELSAIKKDARERARSGANRLMQHSPLSATQPLAQSNSPQRVSTAAQLIAGLVVACSGLVSDYKLKTTTSPMHSDHVMRLCVTSWATSPWSL